MKYSAMSAPFDRRIYGIQEVSLQLLNVSDLIDVLCIDVLCSHSTNSYKSISTFKVRRLV